MLKTFKKMFSIRKKATISSKGGIHAVFSVRLKVLNLFFKNQKMLV